MEAFLYGMVGGAMVSFSEFVRPSSVLDSLMRWIATTICLSVGVCFISRAIAGTLL